ncbi:hypothetical protein M513_03106 [Trichuris suis]|uniref:Integrase catalytic domain-containing protein n=1 Tax=Trichuris suis TaxID=68888 RepID=A0A085MFI6_9BILA|nr:hypothetical protein M513_03106 [Trichuris suis]
MNALSHFTEDPERMPGKLQAEHLWFHIVQRRHFGAEIERILSHKPLQIDSRIRQFDPFVGNDNLLRVGGRNKRSQLDYEARHQILLPNNDYVVTLLLRHLHERKLHAPTEATLAAARQKFWITKGRAAVKRVLRNCVICRKIYSVPYQPKMADFPEGRVTEASPFQRTGVDFAGPLFVRRRQNQAKVYVCLFTCMVTRAIHLELVPSLTTQNFLLAFRRFVARRGRPDCMQSDNFRSFRAADRALNELFNKENRTLIKRELSKDRITWTFITPRSPWCGGYWERLVGSVKIALKKALGHAYVNEQQLSTILCEIEAQINARPLTFLSADPKDMECLTPFHFLTGKAYRQIPNLTDFGAKPQQLSGSELRRKWRAQQTAMAQFWKRWRTEYLVSLTGRNKWKATRAGPRVGDIVLVEEDNVKRQNWKLGRIEQCQSGSDKVVRSVKVRTIDGVVTRPTRKLHLIEPAREVMDDVHRGGSVTSFGGMTSSVPACQV